MDLIGRLMLGQKSILGLEEGNFESIVAYEKQGKAFQLAIPTPEHYLPLVYTLGLKGKQDELSLFNDKLLAGSLSCNFIENWVKSSKKYYKM